MTGTAGEDGRGGILRSGQFAVGVNAGDRTSVGLALGHRHRSMRLAGNMRQYSYSVSQGMATTQGGLYGGLWEGKAEDPVARESRFSARRVLRCSVQAQHQRCRFDLTWAVTRPVLILLPVLGLTWLCGVLVHLSVVVAYVFIALNAFQGLYIFLVYAVYNSEVRNAIKRIKEKRKALSFTNCSQPASFLPSQRSQITSWCHSPPTPSSPEISETSGPHSSTSTSLVIKNESFRKESFVSFSFNTASGNQVVQLTGFKPSGC
ncbi:adhesion G-protein coupled receptor D2 isoform X1 [Lates japonicus]|uniref:Adhesion G-protein coupled receptor D2 isoform X1 n=1 Tax=Lates japonicus TaxID=270547 RepID=A0AAD3MEV7_LATJO|nr:adhesion G-protein coupled receptor D2 isoform X1 [Lates japonicus]